MDSFDRQWQRWFPEDRDKKPVPPAKHGWTTARVFLILAAWSIVWVRKNKTLGTVFIVCMVIAGGILGYTAWHGGEVVYGYSVGMMSLPKAEGDGHNHSHGSGHNHGSKTGSADKHHDDIGDMEMDFSGIDEMMSDDGHNHEH